jgi:hypothetical protein
VDDFRHTGAIGEQDCNSQTVIGLGWQSFQNGLWVLTANLSHWPDRARMAGLASLSGKSESKLTAIKSQILPRSSTMLQTPIKSQIPDLEAFSHGTHQYESPHPSVETDSLSAEIHVTDVSMFFVQLLLYRVAADRRSARRSNNAGIEAMSRVAFDCCGLLPVIRLSLTWQSPLPLPQDIRGVYRTHQLIGSDESLEPDSNITLESVLQPLKQFL